MSPRPIRLRKISKPPVISGFKPYGNKNIKAKPESIFLQYEEYETLRLCDYEMLNQIDASVLMDVSRPTLTRIYAKARQKIAIAIVEGKQIIIEGGKVYFDSDWYNCEKCNCNFNNPEGEKTTENCPLCGSENVNKYNYENGHEKVDDEKCNDLFICPKCGYEQKHQNRIPFNVEACPKCNNIMKSKGSSKCKNLKK